ncbi:MAG: phosphoribosylformylglycinamidine cyclo-ligase [Anaerolineales bacterium]|nr:phosphoribosylformylglycinamidine cyclo-ligase [Anaerolineales bacterium]
MTNPQPPIPNPQSAYATAGVNIDAGNRAVTLMKDAVKSTYTPAVLSEVGSFGGLFSAAALKGMSDPVLVGTTDGVGTKVALAASAGRYRGIDRYRGIGHDIVNHCINDILVQGARPLFFLDYIASSRLDPEMVAEIVTGMAEACRAAGCALLGGETAEMPGVYHDGHFDVAGTLIGVVNRPDLLPRVARPGDKLLGLASSGPHTNGYSLIRRLFDGVPLDHIYPELGFPLADVLLAPHRSYLTLLDGRRKMGDGEEPVPSLLSSVVALAHLTGGGFLENLPRVLPEGCGVRIARNSWPVPPLFPLLQRLSNISDLEMYRVFNMGIGMVAIVRPEHLAEVQAGIPEETWVIGEVVEGKGVTLVES